MPFGGINFGHVLAFQTKCMMKNQYSTLVEALKTNNRKLVIAACLRLGWNDAFRHVSENNDNATIINNCVSYSPNSPHFKMMSAKQDSITDEEKNRLIFKICECLVDYFDEFAKLVNTKERHKYINDKLNEPIFKNLIGIIKKTTESKALCMGHIQKMFNIAMKVLVCLIISYEQAKALPYNVILNEDDCVYLTTNALLDSKEFNYSFDTADCPVDSYILKAVDDKIVKRSQGINGHDKYADIVWSKFGTKEDSNNYISVQNEISNIQFGAGKCNLCFDFENWNS